MKKVLGGFLTCLLFVGNVFATEVAVVDFTAALLQSEIGKEAVKQPQKEIAQMDARLKQEQEDFQVMVQNLKRDDLTLSEEDKKKRHQELAVRQNAIRNLAANMQRQAKALEQQVIESLTPKGEIALKAIIEEKGYDLVLNRKLSLYANTGIDITSELVDRINKDK